MTTVTLTSSNMPSSGDVTLSGNYTLDAYNGYLGTTGECTFTNSLGKKFTNIVVKANNVNFFGGGWTGNTWTGSASSVSFTGEGRGITSIVFTLE